MGRLGVEWIPDWHMKKLTCASCGERRSVKYKTSEGETLCNMCVAAPKRTQAPAHKPTEI